MPIYPNNGTGTMSPSTESNSASQSQMPYISATGEIPKDVQILDRIDNGDETYSVIGRHPTIGEITYTYDSGTDELKSITNAGNELGIDYNTASSASALGTNQTTTTATVIADKKDEDRYSERIYSEGEKDKSEITHANREIITSEEPAETASGPSKHSQSSRSSAPGTNHMELPNGTIINNSTETNPETGITTTTATLQTEEGIKTVKITSGRGNFKRTEIIQPDKTSTVIIENGDNVTTMQKDSAGKIIETKTEYPTTANGKATGGTTIITEKTYSDGTKITETTKNGVTERVSITDDGRKTTTKISPDGRREIINSHVDKDGNEVVDNRTVLSIEDKQNNPDKKQYYTSSEKLDGTFYDGNGEITRKIYQNSVAGGEQANREQEITRENILKLSRDLSNLAGPLNSIKQLKNNWTTDGGTASTERMNQSCTAMSESINSMKAASDVVGNIKLRLEPEQITNGPCAH